MTSRRMIATLAAVLAVSVTIAVLMLLHKSQTNEGNISSDATVLSETTAPKQAKTKNAAPSNAARKRLLSKHGRNSVRSGYADASDEFDDDERTDLPPEDRQLLKSIEQARDDESLEQIVKLIPGASASTNTEIRAELVDALSEFGTSGMNHLLPFMADPDDDVRQNALDSWTSTLGEIKDEKIRAKLITAVMQVLDDEDALESMAMELTDMDEKIAIQTLVDVIEGGKASPKAVAAAREQYEFVTGDEYTTIESADQWLTENYEPKDDKDGAADK